jgi:hypothetical protein
MTDIVERLRELHGQTDAYANNRHHSFVTIQQMARESAALHEEAADEIERLRGRGVFGDDGVPRLLLPQLRAEIIEECAKVAEAWDGKPCGPASGWTDDQRDYYDAGQLDASSSIVRAIRAFAAQGKE